MSCNRFYKLVCYRNEEVEDDQCCGASKTGHKYLNGVAMYSNGKLMHMMERPYHVSEVGGIITIKDAFGDEVKFRASQTVYSLDELIQILNECNHGIAGVPVFNIDGDQVTDNGDGTFAIDVENAVDGAMAFDENGNVYEFDGQFWTLKSSFPTKLSEFDNDVPFVESVVAGDNINVDNADPKNPVVGVTIPEGVCAIQQYDTFNDFPAEPEECALYIDLDTNRQYVSGEKWEKINTTLNFDYGSFSDLPATGDSSLAYFLSDNSEVWYWDGNMYVQTTLYFTNTNLPTTVTDGEYLYFYGSRELYYGNVSAYYDASPPTTNLFSTNLELDENRVHELIRRLTFRLGGGLSSIDINRLDGNYRRIDVRFQRDLIRMQSYVSSSEVHGITISGGVIIYTNQSNINTGTKYFKRGTNGYSTWEDITVPEYASDTAADNDTDLPSGGMYAVTGDRTVKRKP